MKGFKEFIMRGNLLELAIAFVLGGAFATVIKSFTAMLMDIIGKIGNTPNFSAWAPGGVHVGDFITAFIAFVIVAAVVYFFVVKPYEAYRRRRGISEEAADDAQVRLLGEIRDALTRNDAQA